MSLQAKFEEFLSRIELTDEERSKVIKSHQHLRQEILQSLDYVDHTFITGSYKKRTMIRPINDIDIFVVLGSNLPKYEFWAPTPQAILNQLKKDLKAFYQNTTVRQDKPCVVVDFNHCRFEITPAKTQLFLNTGSLCQIPNASDLQHWCIINHPNVLAEKLKKANGKNQLLIPLIKMMKRCKQVNKLKSPASFEMEEWAINNIDNVQTYREGVTRLLHGYRWIRYDERRTLDRMTDGQFEQFCREKCFGNDFPV